MRGQLVAEGDLDGSEAQVEDAFGDEQEGGEPSRVLRSQRRAHEDVRVVTRPAPGHHTDEVVTALGEPPLVGGQGGVGDGDADAKVIGDARETVHPARIVRCDAHQDGTLRRTRGAGAVVDGGRHGSMSSERAASVPSRASTCAEVAPSGREVRR